MSAYFLRLTLTGLVLKQICGQKRVSLENCTGLKDRLINKFTKESCVSSSGKSAEKKKTIDCKEDARNKSRYLGKRRMRSNKKGRVFSKIFSKILHIKRTFKDPMHTPFLPSPAPSHPSFWCCLSTYTFTTTPGRRARNKGSKEFQFNSLLGTPRYSLAVLSGVSVFWSV